MTRRRRWSALRAALALGVAGAGCTVDPVGPGSVASVEVSSAVDTILAGGRTAQLTVTARNAEGELVTGVAVTWSSANSAVVSVNADGVVAAEAAGSALVTATVEGSGVSGALRLRVVNADLAGAGALAGDAFAARVLPGLSVAGREAAEDAWERCATGIETGNVVRVMDGISDLKARAAAADGVDEVLLTVLSLYAEQIQLRLGL